ncbi:MAG: TIM barrel protein [Candidatus Peribacteraceae bacterium]|jgi:deoxyribonuclease-4|nr:TIM barrel protein [Candidatus Peribacteraceae bacterium]MDP7477340.1 TIM barrel protein [Candidatus Peribacteraceae bacterium]
MLHFAVAGVPISTKGKGGTVEGLKQAHALGITAMELEWVQRVPLNVDRMEEIKATAEEFGMYLTIHAPYYINLNAKEKDKLDASKKRILDAMEMGQLAGAHSVCVHPAFYLGMDPDEVFENVRRATGDILTQAKSKNLTINLGYETMGKGTQFGSLEEVLKLSKEFGIYPTVDPAHMHARSNGKWNSTKEWNTMFDMYEEYLGKESLQNVHMHYSGIEYTEKGERKHLPFKQSDAKWEDFLKVLKNRMVEGVVVCESPLLEEDTLLLQKSYNSL